MLKSNWSIGNARLFRPHVIRQRIGRAAPAKSASVHAFMSRYDRAALCAKLERDAAKRAARAG